MSYLICQTLICLLIAAFIGFVLGWYLRRLRCKRECSELQSKLEASENERAGLQAQLRELDSDRDRVQLGKLSQRVAAGPSPQSVMGVTSAVAQADEPSPQTPHSLNAAGNIGSQGITSFEIEEIEGIGKGFGQRLRNIGISTTGDLLTQCPTSSESANVAKKIGLDPDSVQRWVCAADLMRIEGMDKDYAELLVWTGVKNVEQLASQEPNALAARAAAVNEKENRAREVPNATVFSEWVSAGRALRPMLKG